MPKPHVLGSVYKKWAVGCWPWTRGVGACPGRWVGWAVQREPSQLGRALVPKCHPPALPGLQAQETPTVGGPSGGLGSCHVTLSSGSSISM